MAINTEDLKPTFKRFKSTRPTSFEGLDYKAAILRVGSASGPTGGSGPNVNLIWLKILEGLNPYGDAILDIKLTSASLGSQTGISTPNIGVDRHWGYVSIKYHKQEPMDLPKIPDDIDPVYPDIVIPYELPKPPRPKKTTIEADVLFGFDSTRVKKAAESELYDLIYELEKRKVPKVLIEGHADSVGNAGYNIDLSKRRAEAVKSWFIKAGAPDAHRYKTVGRGESDPVADNATSAGRAKNRRVDITID